MRPEEYGNLDRIEGRHWFYRGKREIVQHWIWKFKSKKEKLTLLDCGAGCGTFAKEMAEHVRAVAMDDHQESLRLLRASSSSNPSAVGGSCTKIPFPDACFDMVTALDVLEHIPDDRAAAGEMIRVLRPGGLLVLTVPALMSLWSDWDVSLHHQRRYEKESLLRILNPLPLRCLHLAYINVLAAPAIWAIRKIRLRRRSSGKRAEDWVPPPFFNSLLCFLFVSLGKSKIQFSFGVGLLFVGVKNQVPPLDIPS